MNSEIKALLTLHGLTPPPKVISEEEVVEWLLDLVEDRDKKLRYISNIISMGEGFLTPQMELSL